MESTVENAHHRPWGDRRCDLHPTNEFSRIHAILSYRSSKVSSSFTECCRERGLKAIESLLAMAGLLEDEKEFLLPFHSYPHDGMGTDSVVPNTGFA